MPGSRPYIRLALRCIQNREIRGREENPCLLLACFVWMQWPSFLIFLLSLYRVFFQARWDAACLDASSIRDTLSIGLLLIISVTLNYAFWTSCGMQTERPVITLGLVRPLSKGESPLKNSLEIAGGTELCLWGWQTVRILLLFSGEEILSAKREADLQKCWACLREMGVIKTRSAIWMCRVEVTSSWRDSGGSWTVLT